MKSTGLLSRFKMSSKKRGLSPVVASVLLLLLTVSAVIIVAQFVIPFVKTSLQKSTECVDFANYFSFQERLKFRDRTYRYNCHNISSSGDNLFGISIRADSIDASEGLAGFEIRFVNPEGSKKASVRTNSPGGCGVGEISLLHSCPDMGSLAVPFSGEVVTYVYNAGEELYQKI